MEQRYTDEQIKQMLDIKDFRSISANKIRDFASLIPNMEKEVVLNNAGKVALAAMVVASSMLGLRVVNDKKLLK